jgi:cbb3-type cytochrome oxidase cytochrome c subunit
VPTGKGVLVVLSGGPKPVLFFGRNSKVRRQAIHHHSQNIRNVRATVSRGRLILGWSAFSPEIERYVHYLASRSLEGR